MTENRQRGSLIDAVDRAVDRGYARLRLKIAPGWDVVPVQTVRERYPALPLQADANGSYRLGSGEEDDARRLVQLDDFGLDCIEQPLPATDLSGHAVLADLVATPIGLDESLGTYGAVVEAIGSGACEVACIKPGRLGGLGVARSAVGACLAAGVPAFVGGFFESGLGRSANAALATLPGFTLAGDLSSPVDYLDDDPFGYPPVRHGRITMGDHPGFATSPDRSVLDRVTTAVEWFPGPG